jgi:DNA-directed RNA polymerase specialized sigma24 family protein
MDRADIDRHISQMSTSWTHVQHAHEDSGTRAAAARGEILERYGAAICRYLMAATRDREAADELFQELAVKVLQGDFRKADPRRGRVRDYLKTALFHLVSQRYSRRGRAVPLMLDVADTAGHPEAPSGNEAFAGIWRDELMHRAWQALAEMEKRTGQPVHVVLRFRTDHPDLPSHDVAEQLSKSQGKPLSAEWVRKWLFRGRKVFADLLVVEVASSLEDPSSESVEEELRELALLDYCRAALEDYQRTRNRG